MYKAAIYGKGGIGKSTTVSNVSAALSEKGLKVMQIGCDPKADSTFDLMHGLRVNSVLDLIRQKQNDISLDEIINTGFGGVLCVEAGGPTPGLGCAGRGIIAALELLDEKKAYDIYKPDIVFYDVLGDVVCGGFAMPIREGYAHEVFIVTSGEAMSIYAAMNIATAVDTFKQRGYAGLGGIIVNKRNVPGEDEAVAKLCKDADTKITGVLEHSRLVQECDAMHKTVIEAYPDSLEADMYRTLADSILETLKNSKY